MHPTTHGRVPQDVAPPVLSRRVLVATLIGNFTEWFDFAVYGAVAVTLGRVFFPLEDPAVSLLASRRPSPSRSSCGPSAVHFSVRSATATAAGSRSRWRCWASAWRPPRSRCCRLRDRRAVGAVPARPAALCPGTLRGRRVDQRVGVPRRVRPGEPPRARGEPHLGVGRRRRRHRHRHLARARVGLTPTQMQAWGWRLPFLLAAPLGLVELYLRLRLDETLVYRELRARGSVTTTPLRDAVRTSPGTLAVAFACASATGSASTTSRRTS